MKAKSVKIRSLNSGLPRGIWSLGLFPAELSDWDPPGTVATLYVEEYMTHLSLAGVRRLRDALNQYLETDRE